MNNAVFYHYFIPDGSIVMWSYWLDEQARLMIESGLKDNAKVYMCITMPTHYGSMHNMEFHADRSSNKFNFAQKVVEYINNRYPWIIILSVRSTQEFNLFEGPTLEKMWEYSKVHNGSVLYIHSKGSHSINLGGLAVKNWFEVLNHFLITEWRECLKDLEKFDLVGVQDANPVKIKYLNDMKTNNLVSGNFYWTTTEYLVNLPKPKLLESRYDFERWVLTNDPVVGYRVDTKTNHYRDYCFVENLLEIK